MSKHTPGDWVVGLGGDIVTVSLSPEAPSLIADTTVKPGMPAEQRPLSERQANASLIAASPLLYDFVKNKAEQGDEDAKKIIAQIGL